MNIDDIVREAAETVAEIPALSGYKVIEEDKGDVSKKLEMSVAQQKLAVVVGWNGFTPVASGRHDNGETRGTASVIVTVYEKPIENRTNPSSPRLLQVAQEIARTLNCASSEGMEDVMHLKRISPVAELDRGVITCDVEFSTVGII